MVIDNIFVYHFVDAELKVEVIFSKEGTAENGGIDFEIGDIGTSTHWYWRKKNIAFKKAFLIGSFLNLFICLATIQNQGKDTHYGFYIVDVSRSAGERVFLFSWERLGRGL